MFASTHLSPNLLGALSYRHVDALVRAIEVTIDRIPLDRQGYTREGKYYGVGQPLFALCIETEDGYEYAEIRAESRKALRNAIKASCPGKVSR